MKMTATSADGARGRVARAGGGESLRREQHVNESRSAPFFKAPQTGEPLPLARTTEPHSSPF